MLIRLQLDEQDADKARKWPLAVAALRNERTVPGDLIVLTANRTCARTVGTKGGQDVDPPQRRTRVRDRLPQPATQAP